MQFHFSRLIRLLYFILFYSILLFLFTLPKYVVPEKSSRSNVASCVIRNLFPVYNEYVFIVKICSRDACGCVYELILLFLVCFR